MKVLKNARLIDGTGASPVNSATIVIDGNRIKEVTARSLGDFPADAEVIDVAGMTVLPGLIDCHDHMANHSYDMAHRWRLDVPDQGPPVTMPQVTLYFTSSQTWTVKIRSL